MRTVEQDMVAASSESGGRAQDWRQERGAHVPAQTVGLGHLRLLECVGGALWQLARPHALPKAHLTPGPQARPVPGR